MYIRVWHVFGRFWWCWQKKVVWPFLKLKGSVFSFAAKKMATAATDLSETKYCNCKRKRKR